jgi:hypothetical protein
MAESEAAVPQEVTSATATAAAAEPNAQETGPSARTEPGVRRTESGRSAGAGVEGRQPALERNHSSGRGASGEGASDKWRSQTSDSSSKR